MTLTYADGTRQDAIVLSRTENRMRVIVPGCDDTFELRDVDGNWVTEDCRPVRVEFAWQRERRANATGRSKRGVPVLTINTPVLHPVI